MNVESLITMKRNPKIPEITPGDTVKVSAKIVEGGRERIQVFQGVVIKIKNSGNGSSFTVRHVYQGIGVERTFPFNSPRVEKVEVVRAGKVRRSKLYYLRGLSGKAARKKVKRVEFTRRAIPATEELLGEEEQEPEATATVMEQEAAEVAEEAAETKAASEVEEVEVAIEEAPSAEATEAVEVEAPLAIEEEVKPEAEATTAEQELKVEATNEQEAESSEAAEEDTEKEA